MQSRSQFFRLLEREAAFAVEQFAKPLVAGTVRAADDLGRHFITRLAAGATALEPDIPANGAALGDDRDWVFRVHARLQSQAFPTRGG